MKKIYSSPVIKIISIRPQQMIAASDQSVQIGSDYSGGAVGARRGDSIWDDDDDDDEW